LKRYFIKGIKNPFIWLFFVAVFTVLIQNYIGILYSYDSNVYLYFANKIVYNLDFLRDPRYTPLYSFSLSFLQFSGLNTVQSILVYSLGSYYLILLGFYLISKNSIFSIIGFFTIFSNLTTASVFRFVWTELGYSMFLITAVIGLYKYRISYNTKYKLLFLFSIALLPIQRYIGGYVSLYLGLIYLFLYKKDFIKRGVELSLTIIPIVIVVLWNISLSGNISGPRVKAHLGLIENTKLVLKILYFNFSPEWLIYIVIVFVLFVLIWKKKKPLFLFFLFITPLIQVCSQILASSTYRFNKINTRYFIVLTPLIVFLIFIFFKEISKKNKNHYKYYFLALIIALNLSNVLLLTKRYDVSLGGHKIKRNTKIETFGKVRKFLSSIPKNTNVGIYVRNTKFLQAEFILTSRIIPQNHNQNYSVNKNYKTGNSSYIPQNNNGHIYTPIFMDSIIKPSYLLIHKSYLKNDWQKNFYNYKISNLGSFYGLTKFD